VTARLRKRTRAGTALGRPAAPDAPSGAILTERRER
jgi:hypothetical protein